MWSSAWTIASLILPFVTHTRARLPDGRPHANTLPFPKVPVVTADDLRVTDITGATLPPLSTIYTFDQLIDHTNPSLGTFQQRYWTTWEWYETGKLLHGIVCDESLTTWMILRRACHFVHAWRGEC